MPDIQIRAATRADAALILQYVKELATYESANSEVTATVEDIQKSIFGDNSIAHALICSINEEPVGFAIYFYNYSTWLGKNGLYLEDLYIIPKHRAKGAGKKLLKHLAAIAVSKDCGRFEWSVLDWNQPAIKVYKSIGANPQSEWIRYRLEDEALKDVAKA